MDTYDAFIVIKMESRENPKHRKDQQFTIFRKEGFFEMPNLLVIINITRVIIP